MDNKVIKILEEDIIELGESICNERIAQQQKPFSFEVSDYKQYKKLIDTFVTNFRTYLRFQEVKYDNAICLRFKNWCETEIEEIHGVMKECQNNNYDQYRCLSYVYTKLLNELNSYNLRKPIKINDDITIEVEGRTLGEVMEDIASAWDKLNEHDKGNSIRVILNGFAKQTGDSMNNMGKSLKSVLKRYEEKA